MGGEIQVESQVGQGTVFRTMLPVARGDRVVGTPVPSAIPAAKRGCVLVIDDEPILGTAIRRMLSPEHQVHAVASARDAIDRVTRGERFDVILCDLMMPEVTGMDLHAELSRLAPEQTDRIVFMTGGAFTAQAREFLDLVRNPRIEKPFEIDNLRALVQSVMR